MTLSSLSSSNVRILAEISEGLINSILFHASVIDPFKTPQKLLRGDFKRINR